MKTISMLAGVVVRFEERGDFFRIMQSTAPLTVRYYRGGKPACEPAADVAAGYAERFQTAPFDIVELVSATDQAVQFVIRLGNEVDYDQTPTGAVVLSGQQGAYIQSEHAPGAANTLIKAAKSNRRYLMLQNKHATDSIMLTFDGSAPSATVGMKLAPGGFYEPLLAPTGAIRAWGTASTPPLVCIEV